MTREEAIICLKGIKKYGRDTFNEQSDWQGCLDMAIQSLEQEPKTGKWIRFVVNGQHKIRCDKCDYIEPKYVTYIRNYCPNCGVKMESEVQNEDSD